LYVLILLVGISVLLYPSISSAISASKQKAEMDKYNQAVEMMSDEDQATLLAAAQEYNLALTRGDKSSGVYYADTLNLTDMMGTIVIPKIGLELPIYHGTAESALQKGVGHMEGTSLPSGEPGTHAVLTGHRGLPSAELFTHIDQLQEGDSFFIRILNTVSQYQVIRITIIDPESYNSEVFAIDPEKAVVTLLTCHPYGVNTHRLLVTGVKLDNTDISVLEDFENSKAQEVVFRAEEESESGYYFVGLPQKTMESPIVEEGINPKAILLVVAGMLLVVSVIVDLSRKNNRY